jgi:hypothetical protein
MFLQSFFAKFFAETVVMSHCDYAFPIDILLKYIDSCCVLPVWFC